MTEFFAAIPPGMWAVIGSIFGGIGLKVAERWLNRSAAFREEKQDYRAEIKELQDRLDKIEGDLDTWKSKYWASQEEVARLRQALIRAGIEVPQIASPKGS